jgi:hypothetical protein
MLLSLNHLFQTPGHARPFQTPAAFVLSKCAPSSWLLVPCCRLAAAVPPRATRHPVPPRATRHLCKVSFQQVPPLIITWLSHTHTPHPCSHSLEGRTCRSSPLDPAVGSEPALNGTACKFAGIREQRGEA